MSDGDQSARARMRVMAARVVAQQRWPYLSSLLFSLHLVPVPEGLPTMAVDEDWRLYYSPDFALSQTTDSSATAVLHEALHILHGHAARFRAVNGAPEASVLWNLAADCAINATLDGAGMPSGLEPVRYRTLRRCGVAEAMTTEQVYRRLERAAPGCLQC